SWMLLPHRRVPTAAIIPVQNHHLHIRLLQTLNYKRRLMYLTLAKKWHYWWALVAWAQPMKLSKCATPSAPALQKRYWVKLHCPTPFRLLPAALAFWVRKPVTI